ncbi:hypothetical protein LPJ61_005279, partial [Coemansia biformis]
MDAGLPGEATPLCRPDADDGPHHHVVDYGSTDVRAHALVLPAHDIGGPVWNFL